MKLKNIFIGTIKKCTDIKFYQTCYSDGYAIIGGGYHIEKICKTYKKNAILIKTKNGYIDLDTINNTFDYLKAILIKENLLSTNLPNYKDELYIDEDSLNQYSYIEDKINVKQLKFIESHRHNYGYKFLTK